MSNRTDAEWCSQLAGAAPDAALADLRGLLLRGLHFALTSYRVTESDLEDFVQDWSKYCRSYPLIGAKRASQPGRKRFVCGWR